MLSFACAGTRGRMQAPQRENQTLQARRRVQHALAFSAAIQMRGIGRQIRGLQIHDSTVGLEIRHEAFNLLA